jgi:hypothetical protein
MISEELPHGNQEGLGPEALKINRRLPFGACEDFLCNFPPPKEVGSEVWISNGKDDLLPAHHRARAGEGPWNKRYTAFV